MTAHLIRQLEEEEVSRACAKRPIPDFSAGDTLKVLVKVREGERERLQRFEGVCLERSGEGINKRFTVRKISFGEGVEQVFPIYSPRIHSVEVARRGNVRRSKLYYLRDRRGRAARIPELVETKIRPSRPIDVRFDGSQVDAYIKAMVGAIQRLQALEGAAEGYKVLKAVQKTVSGLPRTKTECVSDSFNIEYALTVADQLCPLAFSPDKKVSFWAKKGLAELSLLIGLSGKGEGRIRDLLLHIRAAIVCRLSVRCVADDALVYLEVSDLVHAITGLPGPALDTPVAIQILLEDMMKPDSELLTMVDIGASCSRTQHFTLSPPKGELINKLLTIMADGQEVCRLRLGGDAERIFIL